MDQIVLPSLMDLAERYQPDVFWADGAGDAPCTHDSTTYWKAPDFISWLYNNGDNIKPGYGSSVIVNSRWGTNSGGDYQTGGDRFTPGKALPYKFESCFTVQKSSWGYDRTEDINSYWDSTDLIYQLVDTVACGGNLLLNVGPTADGRIMPAFQERLQDIGAWLSVNGEAIYNTTTWRQQNDTAAQRIWYTAPKSDYAHTAYAITFDWPSIGDDLVLHQVNVTSSTVVTMLGYKGEVSFTALPSGGVSVHVPQLSIQDMPCDHAWVIKLQNVN